MYRIIPDGMWWLVVQQVGDTQVLLHRCKTHAEALSARQGLIGMLDEDTYDNYIVM